MTKDRDDTAARVAAEMAEATDRLRQRVHLLAVTPQPRVSPPPPRRAPGEDGGVADGVTVEDDEMAGFRVARLSGTMDYYGAGQLRQQLYDRITTDPVLIVDLDGVEFMDSVGLSVLIGAYKRARRAGGLVRIVGTRPEIALLFRVTGIQRAFPLHDSVEEAVAAFSG